MAATLTHLSILAAVCLPGLAALVQDATTHTQGGLFSPYTFTKVIWIGIGTYALASSLLVVMVAALRHRRGRPYAVFGVLLTHAVAVGILALLLSLGVHDRIQDAWRSDEARSRPAPTAPSGERPRAPQGAPVALRPLPRPAPSQAVPAGGEPKPVAPALRAQD